MEILICVKQVPDDSVEIHLDESTKQPDISRADPQASAFETYALEMAARYVEENEGTITVVSVGPEDNVTSLKSCLAVGAKKGFLISDPALENADDAVIANVLAAAIPKIEEENGAKFDLIFCGKESTDYINGQVGPLLAQKLGLSSITNIVAFEPTDAGAVVKKELDAGYLMIETPLPAVVTASKPDYDPRFPTIKNKLAARKIQVPVLTATDIAIDAADLAPTVTYVSFDAPAKKEAGIKINEEDPEAAVAQLMDQLAADKVL